MAYPITVVRLSNEKKLIVLVGLLLLIQIIGRYYSKPFIALESFDSLKFVLAAIIPIVVGRAFIFDSFREMGFALPKLKTQYWIYLIAAFVLIPIVVSQINSSESYLQYYDRYRQSQISLESRLQRFALFALSTITGWEILHRGFLLPGLRKIFESLKIQISTCEILAVLWVLSFEVVYHFVKPDLESWGMLVFSPVASILTIRSKSIWPALFLHLWIETVFILNVTGAINI